MCKVNQITEIYITNLRKYKEVLLFMTVEAKSLHSFGGVDGKVLRQRILIGIQNVVYAFNPGRLEPIPISSNRNASGIIFDANRTNGPITFFADKIRGLDRYAAINRARQEVADNASRNGKAHHVSNSRKHHWWEGVCHYFNKPKKR